MRWAKNSVPRIGIRQKRLETPVLAVEYAQFQKDIRNFHRRFRTGRAASGKSKFFNVTRSDAGRGVIRYAW
jgi:hypothetical protein